VERAGALASSASLAKLGAGAVEEKLIASLNPRHSLLLLLSTEACEPKRMN
jgi:hypothetical protein